MELPRLPINKIGKVQYSELVELFLSASEGTPVQPVTLVQQILKRIWSEILGIEEIGVTDHFLDLGGDSISPSAPWASRHRSWRGGVSLFPANLCVVQKSAGHRARDAGP